LVETTNPIFLILLNDKYVILCNIQTPLNLGSTKGAIVAVFLNRKDDRLRVENLIKLITSQAKGEKITFNELLPGITSKTARINAYAKLIIIPSMLILVTGCIILNILGIINR